MIWLLLILLAALFTLGVQLYTGVPPFPSTQAEQGAVTKLLLQHNLREGEIVELGCGWGGLLFALARAFPDRQIVGIELSPLPALFSKVRALRYPNVRVRWGNFFHYPLQDAAAVTCYLMMGPMEGVGRKLSEELREGTPVVAVAFHFRDRVPEQEQQPTGLMPGSVALYRWKP